VKDLGTSGSKHHHVERHFTAAEWRETLLAGVDPDVIVRAQRPLDSMVVPVGRTEAELPLARAEGDR
jgi:hypothetical protein